MNSIYQTPNAPATTASLFQSHQRTFQPILPYGWWEEVYYNFRYLAAHFGIAVNVHRTWFSGFYQEGAGSSYEAEIDVYQLLACYKEKRWQTLLPPDEITVPEILIDPAVMDLLENGSIQAQGHVRSLKDKTRIYVAMEFKYPKTIPAPYRELDEQIEQFIDAVITLCDELNQVLFARLLHAYESHVFR